MPCHYTTSTRPLPPPHSRPLQPVADLTSSENRWYFWAQTSPTVPPGIELNLRLRPSSAPWTPTPPATAPPCESNNTAKRLSTTSPSWSRTSWCSSTVVRSSNPPVSFSTVTGSAKVNSVRWVDCNTRTIRCGTPF